MWAFTRRPADSVTSRSQSWVVLRTPCHVRMSAVHVVMGFCARQSTRATDLLESYVGNEMMANLVGE